MHSLFVFLACVGYGVSYTPSGVMTTGMDPILFCLTPPESTFGAGIYVSHPTPPKGEVGKAFKDWYAKHHPDLVFRKQGAVLSYELRFLPNEVTIYQELQHDANVTKKRIRELYAQYDTYATYSFKLISPDGQNLLLSQSEDMAAYQEKQFYLIESVRNDFRLVRNNDTLAPIDCQFENNYGTAPFLQLHLVFEKAPKGVKNQRTQLIYTDRLFTSDTLVFDCPFLTELQIPQIR